MIGRLASRSRAISPCRLDTYLCRGLPMESAALRVGNPGGLDGDMTSEELNLLRFAAGCPAGPTEAVGARLVTPVFDRIPLRRARA